MTRFVPSRRSFWVAMLPVVMVVVPLVCVLAAGRATAAAPQVPAADVFFENALASLCETEKVPALLAAEVSPEGVVRSAAAGVRTREVSTYEGEAAAAHLDDAFSLASCGKALTSALAAAIVDDGRLTWTTTIAEVWPEATVHESVQGVTLEQLLSHAGGLPESLEGRAWASFFRERNPPRAERERLCRLVLRKPAASPVGEFSYSNVGYVVAAAMIEQRTDTPYEQLMQERLFTPLKMTATRFHDRETLRQAEQPLLWGHDDDGDPVRPGASGSENPTVYASASTIRTTLGDWGKFIAWTLRGEPGPVLKSPETVERLRMALVDRGDGTKYGYGWIRFEIPGLGEVAQHGGSNTTNYVLVWLLPERKRATLVVTNTGEKHAFATCDATTQWLFQTMGRE